MKSASSSSAVAKDLYEALMHVETTGAFATGGKLEGCPPPGLVVEGVGAIALPLPPDQAKALTEHPDTVIDTAVRLCRQIEPSKIRFGAAWNYYIRDLATEYANLLGVSNDNVEARLYQLVLYEEGGFFASHKDTEKEPGMFGFLVVQLPTKHDDGILAVRHRGEEMRFDFSDSKRSYSDPRSYYAAAFYADCEHELHLANNGLRLCLLYTLVRMGGNGPRPSLAKQAAERDAQCSRLLRIANQWGKDIDAPEKLCLTLYNDYTIKNPEYGYDDFERKFTSNLGFRNLKGYDKLRVDALLRSDSFELHLAILEKHKSGSAEYKLTKYEKYGYNGSYDSDDSDNYHEMLKCHKTTTEVKKWINVMDTEVKLKGLVIDLDGEILQHEEDPLLFDSDFDEPDEEGYQSDRGDSGPTVQYWYRRNMLVIWPRSKSMDITFNASFEAAVQIAKQRVTMKTADALTTLQEVVEYATRHADLACEHFASLIEVACTMKHTKSVLFAMELLGQQGGCSTFGRREAMKVAINLLGWDSDTRSVTMNVLVATPPDRLHHAATLALNLDGLGTSFKEAASDIAKEVAKQFLGMSTLDDSSADMVAKILFFFSCCDEERAAFISRSAELPAKTLSSILKIVYSMYRDQTMPDGFTRLASSYMSRTFSNYSNAEERNSTDHVATVFSIVLNTKNEELLGNFIRNVCETNDANLLQTLCRSALPMAPNAHTRMLAAARADQLRYPKPIHSNEQLLANVPGEPEITSFLRSDRSAVRCTPFNDLKHARNFGQQHFRGYYNKDECHSAKAKAIADDRGSGACLIITKTEYYYKEMLAKYESDQLELLSLQPLLDEPIQQESKRQKANDNPSVESSSTDLTDEAS